ncbi:MAG: NAD(P)-binding protein, partial [Mycolicibacterium frederiksbergense]|nr:NAD(P)-binding protein [Mycolicibacterium frederiksbergense]
MRSTYCVVGGGISGLTAAHRLRVAAGPDASITLFDPADRLGGVLRTEQVGGMSMDVGAEAFITRRPEVTALLAELGLSGRQVASAGARPLIYSQGCLHPLPAGTLQGIPAQAESVAGLVDAATVARAATKGFTTLLAGQHDLSESLIEVPQSGFALLPSGPVPSVRRE